MSAIHRHTLYGLRVAAPFTLPGPAYDGVPEVIIEEGSCPEALDNPLQSNERLQIAAHACLIKVPSMGNVLIERRGRIVIDCPDNLPHAWKLTLALGSGLGIYLHMIGRLPLHGMAWRQNGSATLVLGRSGTGKSTLAAAMLHCGHTLLSDDVVPISLNLDHTAIAHPAHRRFKLSPALLNALGVDIHPLQHVLPGSDKLAWSIPDDKFHSEPASVSRCIILLPERQASQQLVLQPVKSLAALQRLKRQVYRPQLVKKLGQENQLFGMVHQIATQANVYLCSLPDLRQFNSFAHYANTLNSGFNEEN